MKRNRLLIGGGPVEAGPMDGGDNVGFTIGPVISGLEAEDITDELTIYGSRADMRKLRDALSRALHQAADLRKLEQESHIYWLRERLGLAR